MSQRSRWIRLNVDWEDSPWLDSLDGTAAGCWPRLLCWVKTKGASGCCKAADAGVLARKWRVKKRAVEALVNAAKKDGALVEEDGMWEIANWATYQPDPTAATRMREHRQRRKAEANGALP